MDTYRVWIKTDLGNEYKGLAKAQNASEAIKSLALKWGLYSNDIKHARVDLEEG